jgi:hypothetical protein
VVRAEKEEAGQMLGVAGMEEAGKWDGLLSRSIFLPVHEYEKCNFHLL